MTQDERRKIKKLYDELEHVDPDVVGDDAAIEMYDLFEAIRSAREGLRELLQ